MSFVYPLFPAARRSILSEPVADIQEQIELMDIGGLEAESDRADRSIVRDTDVPAIDYMVEVPYHVDNLVFGFSDPAAQTEVKIFD